MSNQKKNIFHNLNFNAFFPEFENAVKEACEKYWEVETTFDLTALNDFKELRQEYLVLDSDFFSNRIKVENHKPVIIRFDEEFVDSFLNIALEKKDSNFELSKLTPLEAKILNNFAEFLYKKIKDILIPERQVKLSEESEKSVNFLFSISPQGGSLGQIMFSIALDRIPFNPLKKAVSFKDEDFLTSNTTVSIRIGTSKVTLEDLENLSPEDIILLEDSNISYLTLVSGKLEKKFKVKANPDLVMDIGEDEEENIEENDNNDEVIMEKNLWDDIQIEVSAEFEKVKMTIGELKQITQGQVVDLGSVFNNEISLFVEDKKVAKGELIIINDRYAVKLNEVLSSAKTAPAPAAQPQPQQKAAPAPAPKAVASQAASKTAATPPPKQAPKAAPAPKQAPKVEDEEFDYSDFEK